MSDKTLVEQIRHYQKDIERCPDNAERMIRCIKRLYVLPILVQHLQETGVGRSVNGLRKYNGEVGEAAKSLVAKWKAMVAADESDEDHKQPAPVQPPAHQPEHSRDRDRDRDHASRHSEGRSRHHHEKRVDSKSERDRHKRDKKSPEKKKHSSGDRHKSSSSSKMETDSSDRRKRKKESEEKDDRRKRMKIVQESESEDEEEDSRSEEEREEELSEAESVRERLTEEEEEEDAEEMENTNMEESQEEKSSQESGSDSDSSSGSSSESSDSRHRHKGSSSSSSKHAKNHRSDNKSSSGSRHKSSSSGGTGSKSHHHTSSSSSSRPTTSSFSSHTNKDDKRHHKDSSSSNKSRSEKSSERTSHHHKSSSSHSSSDKTRDKSRNSQASDMEALIRENEKKIKKERQEGETSNSHRKEDKKRSSSVNSTATAPVKTEKISKLVKIEKNEDGSIDAGSGASFAEALMVGDAVRSKKKKKLSSNGTTTTTSTTTSSSSVTPSKKYSSSSEVKRSTEGTSKSAGSSSSKSSGSSHHHNSSPSETADLMKMPELLSNPKKFKSEPLNLDISSTLPEISPNYRPLPHVPDSSYRKSNKTLSEEEAMSSIMTTKYQRTKVFSGNKTGLYATVPSLYSLCIQLLYENIDAVEYTGGVPYDILKPLLEKLNADQLYVLEHHNPYLIDDTDPLWQFHCKKDFRSEIRQELESWRELYLRCMDEREKKLKALTQNISQSMAKSTPVRQAKLAYVDSVAKPPRNIAKKQAKYGTGTSDKKHEILKKAAVGGHTPGIAARDVVPPPPPSAGGGSSSMSSRQSQQILKKKKAPLMAKALQLIKGNRFKR